MGRGVGEVHGAVEPAAAAAADDDEAAAAAGAGVVSVAAAVETFAGEAVGVGAADSVSRGRCADGGGERDVGPRLFVFLHFIQTVRSA